MLHVVRFLAWFGLSVCFSLGIASGRALAFGDLFRFDDSAAVGGGGGRWFTGSPAEGYGCEVCHEGPESEEVTVQGLPEVYVPGLSYDVYVSWPATYAHVMALAELTDELGHGAGTVALSQAEIPPAESCQPIEQPTPAAIVLTSPDVTLTNNRQLVGMQDCGGNVMHFRWSAPATDIGPVLFSGGLVQPDAMMTVEGDRSVRLFKPIASVSRRLSDVEVNNACSVGPAIGSRSGGCAWVLAMLGVGWLWRSRQRRSA